jgi:DNA-binding transcriptional MerR regulator
MGSDEQHHRRSDDSDRLEWIFLLRKLCDLGLPLLSVNRIQRG